MRIQKRALAVVVVLVLQLTFSYLVFTPVSVQAATPPAKVVFSLFDSTDLPAVTSQYTLSGAKALFTPNSYLAYVPTGADPAAVANAMSADTRVESVSPDYGMSLVESGNFFSMDAHSFNFDPATGVNLTSSAGYATAAGQWAWSKTYLSTGQKLSTGKGVIVAVLDTGVDFNHPDLQSHTLPGFDALGVYPDGRDVQGHGTFVAGIIAQIAPGATIMPVRVLDANGLGTVDSVMNGLQYALNNGVKVANLSLSSTFDSSSLHKVIQNARSKGMTIIVAAGNDNSGAKYYPASYGENIPISATDNRDYRASFSNWQGYMELSGPGVDIYSMWKGGGYGWASGTSFSTPMVTGAAVIVKALHPTYSPDQVKGAVKAAVDKFGAGCSCSGMGAGRLNFSKLK